MLNGGGRKIAVIKEPFFPTAGIAAEPDAVFEGGVRVAVVGDAAADAPLGARRCVRAFVR